MASPWTPLSPWLVGVRSVFDGNNLDAMVVHVDAVDHAVVASSGNVQACELQVQMFTDAMRVGRQRAVEELDDRRGDFLRQAA